MTGTTQTAFAEMNDLGLHEAITAGVPEAFAEAYRRQGSRVYGLVRRMCGQARAEDVVHEVCLRLWQRPDRYQADRGSKRALLLLQAHSLAVDGLRSDSTRQARESADFLSRITSGGEGESVTLTNLAGAAVARALAALPDRERHPIVLAYFGGYPYRHVATMLGQPEGTIKGRIRSGMAALRFQLGDDGHDESRVRTPPGLAEWAPRQDDADRGVAPSSGRPPPPSIDDEAAARTCRSIRRSPCGDEASGSRFIGTSRRSTRRW